MGAPPSQLLLRNVGVAVEYRSHGDWLLSAHSALEPNHQHQLFSGTLTAGIWRFLGERCWAVTFLFPHFSLGWFIVIVS